LVEVSGAPPRAVVGSWHDDLWRRPPSSGSSSSCSSSAGFSFRTFGRSDAATHLWCETCCAEKKNREEQKKETEEEMVNKNKERGNKE